MHWSRRGFLEIRDDGFRNSLEAAVYLVRGKPGYIGDEHQLFDQLWHADLLTATSIRQRQPAAKHDFASADPGSSLAFFRGLAPIALIFGRRLAEMIDLREVNSAIDIGGGPGAFADRPARNKTGPAVDAAGIGTERRPCERASRR